MKKYLRQIVIWLIFPLTYMLRLHRFAAPFTRGAGAILMFHNICPITGRTLHINAMNEIEATSLARVIELVRAEGYEIVSFDEALVRLEMPQPKPFVVLTFDDGYRNFKENALPVLRRLNAPFTLYVVPGFMDATASMWWAELEEAIHKLDQLDIDMFGISFHAEIKTREQKEKAANEFYWQLRKLGEPDLRAVTQALACRAGIYPLDFAQGAPNPLTQAACLTWEEMREIAQDPLCTIGAHTMTHPRLAFLTEQEAESEMAQSKQQIEAFLGKSIHHFAYPIGDVTSAGPREFELAKKLGFRSCVTTRAGVLTNVAIRDKAALPRLPVGGIWQKPMYFKVLLSGLPSWFRKS